MGGLIARRLAGLAGILLGLTVIVFLLQTVIPADPARAVVGAGASAEVVEAKRAELGLDEPLHERFGAFVGRLGAGDLGESLRTRNPVADDLRTFVPATLELALTAALLALAIGFGLGLLLAGGGRLAGAARLVLIGGASRPTFLVGLVGVLVLYSQLGLLPASGRVDEALGVPGGPTGLLVLDSLVAGDLTLLGSALSHLALPALTLALTPALALARTLKTSLDQVLGEDYIRTARAKGLPDRTVLLRHALRNAVNPTLTMAGLQFGLLLGGMVVVELIFAWPGLGLFLAQSIAYSDFPAITGVTLLLGTAYVVVNFLVDLGQAAADPRIRSV